MNGHEQEFSAFWLAVANALNGGRALAEAIEEGRAKVTQADAASAVERVLSAVRAGKTLGDALAQEPSFFDRAIVATIAVGESADHLRAAATEVARLFAGGASAAADVALADRPAAIRYVADLLRKASESRASDLQLDPTEDGRGMVRLRADGVLHLVDPPLRGLFRSIIDHIKALGAMDVAERRLPQYGRCIGEDYSLRITTAPVHHGERASVLLATRRPEQLVLGLDKLGLDEADLATVRKLAHLPSGLIIVNGPTGCGKTTLLYSMLLEIAKPEVNILTVEDPVELALPGVGQMALRPDVGLTFPRAIISMLRQAPNVMMVGEIRDLETAQLCHQAGLTGHLVLTTLHANTSPEAVGRFLDLGIERWLLSACLSAVISMRLVRTLCPHCRKPAPPTGQLPPMVRRFVESGGDATFFAPVGCDKCGGRGFLGRTGLYEILVCEDRIRQAVAGGAGAPALREAAAASGMRSMLLDGVQKAARGITTVEEVLRTVPVQDWQ